MTAIDVESVVDKSRLATGGSECSVPIESEEKTDDIIPMIDDVSWLSTCCEGLGLRSPCRSYSLATSLLRQLPLIAFISWCRDMCALGHGHVTRNPTYYDMPCAVIVSKEGRIVQRRFGDTVKSRVLLWWGVKGSAISMNRVHPLNDPRTNLTRVINSGITVLIIDYVLFVAANWSCDLYMQYWLGRASSLFSDGGPIWWCSRHMLQPQQNQVRASR